jgi:hypothetical protein
MGRVVDIVGVGVILVAILLLALIVADAQVPVVMWRPGWAEARRRHVGPGTFRQAEQV